MRKYDLIEEMLRFKIQKMYKQRRTYYLFTLRTLAKSPPHQDIVQIGQHFLKEFLLVARKKVLCLRMKLQKNINTFLGKIELGQK